MPHSVRPIAAMSLLVVLAATAPALPAQQRSAESRAPRDPIQEGRPQNPSRLVSFKNRIGNWM